MTDVLISDALARAAREQSDRPAIDFGDLRLTWAQWHERVRRAAGALAAAGVGPGDRVAVIDRNHIACLDILLAAGSIGAVTALLNWRLAEPELERLLTDCSPTIAFVGSGLSAPGVETVIALDDDYEDWLAGGTPTDGGAAGEDPALIIYTSGTTGQPKGALFSHRGLIANSEESARAGAMGPDDHVLVSMPMFHVGGVGSALGAVHAGVPLTLLREPRADAIVNALEHGCTRAFLVPAVIASLLDAGPRERAALASLRLLTYGGAPCPAPVLEQVLADMPATQLVQVYGMTELCGTVTALSAEAHRDASRPERLLSVGQPVDAVEVRVVDPATLSEVPSGTAGELWFRTPKRMLGYLNQPELTAEVVVDDGWVRTGDIGRIDDGGFIFIVDRLKDVIITGGENVYSPGVEAVLVAHPGIAEAAVIGVPDARMGEAVLAVVTPVDGASFDTDEVLAFCRDRLAGFQRPRRIEVVDSLPRNPSGKVLKADLRQRFGSVRKPTG